MPQSAPRVEILPLPDYQVAFLVAGKERGRWHFGRQYPRPFLYPLVAPHGVPATRMGHPAAPNHDHHRSVWFGHADIGGVNFWADGAGTQQVRQTSWTHYQDGERVAIAYVRLGWFDPHGVELLSQDLMIACMDAGDEETLWEIQSEFRTPGTELTLGKTNFGFLGVRVAKGISALFGSGALRSSEGDTGERAIFGRSFPWIDYSGHARGNLPSGIAFFDHPENPRHPTVWHVRDDGWMCASFCMQEPYVLQRGQTLRLRYGLYVHSDCYPREQIRNHYDVFANTTAWRNVGRKGPYPVWLERTR